MGARGKTCGVCSSGVAEDVDRAIAAPMSVPALAKKFPQFTTSQLVNHRMNHVRKIEAARAVAAANGPRPPTYPKLPDTATPLERSAATCEWLRLQIDHAVATNAAQKEMTQLIGQLTNANRLHARLSGALDITESQIVRSAPWARIMVVLRDALKKHPKALAEVTEAIEALAEGER
jgi:hypothetical protein